MHLQVVSKCLTVFAAAGHFNLWTLSVPVTSKYNSAMQDFTDLTYTSPQNASDLEKIQIKLAVCSPFTSDPTLRNIVNGIVADQDVIM
jgi:hypothetical protein